MLLFKKKKSLKTPPKIFLPKQITPSIPPGWLCPSRSYAPSQPRRLPNAFSGGHFWKLTYFRQRPHSWRSEALSQNKNKEVIPISLFFSFPFFHSRAEGAYFSSEKHEGSQGKCAAHPSAAEPRRSRCTVHAPLSLPRGNLGSFVAVVVVELFYFGLCLTPRAPRCAFPTVIHGAFGGCYQQLPAGCTQGIKIFPSIIFQSFNTRAILSLLF